MEKFTPNIQDKECMSGLQDAIIAHIRRHIAKRRSEEYCNEENGRFYDYVETLISDPPATAWQFMIGDIPDYPFSPVYGAILIFEYEDETVYYGWDSGRYGIEFFGLPSHLSIDIENYITMEDILNEPIRQIKYAEAV